METVNQNQKMYKCLHSTNSVGIEFKKDIINIYFPLGYKIPDCNNEIEEKKAILDLIRTISLCKNNGEREEYNFENGETENIPVNSYLWLINDYLKNGLYNVFEKKYIQSQKGKINWKKTFKTKPVFNEKEIVYLNPITELKSKNANIISEIHAVCVNISIDKIGWIFGSINKIDNYQQSYTDDMYLDILNRELVKTFDDKKKILLRHLINVISKKSNNDMSDLVNDLLTNNYQIAWEKMIDHVFGNVIDKKEFFPEIIWDLHKKNNPKPTMRPDTIIKNNKEIYIIDAKYYKYGVEENGSLPGAEAIDKQITYGEFNSDKFNTSEVYNAFIMPFNMNDELFKSSIPIITIGNVRSIGRTSTGKPYEKIVVILMDTKYLIDLFFHRIEKDEILLIKNIMNELDIDKKKNEK